MVQPGVLYLMHTEEVVAPGPYVGCLDGKSSIGRLGVLVHYTAGYVDTGYRGQLTLEVSATLPTRLYPGMRIAQIRFHTVVGPVVDYAAKGHYTGDAAKGPVPSQVHKQFEGEKKP